MRITERQLRKIIRESLVREGSGFGDVKLAEFEHEYEQKLSQFGKPSKYFDWKDFTKSDAAEEQKLDNHLSDEAIKNILALSRNVLDPINDAVGGRARITSGYRSLAVNAAVDGAEKSQHTNGEAVDIKVDGMEAIDLARLVARLGVPFDKIIWYHSARGGHVHVSHMVSGNRGKTLHAPARGGYVSWKP